MLLVGVLRCLFCAANIVVVAVGALKFRVQRRRHRGIGSDEPRFAVIELIAWTAALPVGGWLVWRVEISGLLIG
jgi:hypothetical protein